MTRAQFPILDLSLRCGTKLHDVSLWREEALVELYIGDKVEVTHLRANIRPNGGGKFDSSNYTTVKVNINFKDYQRQVNSHFTN